MLANAVSACISTHKIQQSRDFYVKYFAANVTFDCGWYVNLQFGKDSSTLQFMSPQPDQPAFYPQGLVLNFAVADVDAEYDRLTTAGLRPVMPLADHPWGDRGFAVQDPNGLLLYLYSEREPSAEFKPYYTA